MHGKTEIKVHPELSCIPVPAQQSAVGILLAIPRLKKTGTQQPKLGVRKDMQEQTTKPSADNDDFF